MFLQRVFIAAETMGCFGSNLPVAPYLADGSLPLDSFRAGRMSVTEEMAQFRAFRLSADHSLALWSAVGSRRLEKRPGAGFNVVTGRSCAPADGYTLLGRQP
jgi:hypothetical protein